MARVRDPGSRDGALDRRTPTRARTASPHGKLGFGLFAFLACIVVGAGGGRFVSYVMRATLNPPFTLKLAVGQRFPSFALTDQNDSIHHGPAPTMRAPR